MAGNKGLAQGSLTLMPVWDGDRYWRMMMGRSFVAGRAVARREV